MTQFKLVQPPELTTEEIAFAISEAESLRRELKDKAEQIANLRQWFPVSHRNHLDAMANNLIAMSECVIGGMLIDLISKRLNAGAK